ncbi:MAG: inositol monophosphatase [Acidimicrobiia bacterium]|nr:inositol monophosphatase [Acidimicrobiia bacterium]
MVPAEELLELALDVGRRATELLRAAPERPSLRVDTKSSATDLVTEMDQAVEALIVEQLRGARPDDAIVGEEGGRGDGGSGVCWFIDPIDGTTNFVYGHPGYAVSIAARVADVTVAGAVLVPTLGEEFAARLGGGATCNGEPIRATSAGTVAGALVATGFSYDAERRIRQGKVVTELLGQVRDLRRMGAAAVDLCSVACGRVDGYFEAGLAPWDHMAGALIAAEAGAWVGDLDGGAPSTQMTVAAAPWLASDLRALLTTAGAREV